MDYSVSMEHLCHPTLKAQDHHGRPGQKILRIRDQGGLDGMVSSGL